MLMMRFRAETPQTLAALLASARGLRMVPWLEATLKKRKPSSWRSIVAKTRHVVLTEETIAYTGKKAASIPKGYITISPDMCVTLKKGGRCVHHPGSWPAFGGAAVLTWFAGSFLVQTAVATHSFKCANEHIAETWAQVVYLQAFPLYSLPLCQRPSPVPSPLCRPSV